MSEKRILIVEDEFIIAQNLRQVLQDYGYVVQGHAFDADEAIAFMQTKQVDLALVDINLGKGMDGIALGKQLRETYKIPFIFITSHSDKATIARAKDALPAGYLVKPFNNAEVYAAVEILLAQQVGSPQDHIFVKLSNSIKKVMLSEVTMLKADRVYVEIHRKGAAPLVVRGSISNWEAKLPADFVRVHRSFIIHIKYLDALDTNSVVVDGKEIAITRQVRDELAAQLQSR